ncbi:MAG: hypothetical protein ACT4PP_17090 [Sporichthyaceae bacterium]
MADRRERARLCRSWLFLGGVEVAGRLVEYPTYLNARRTLQRAQDLAPPRGSPT